MAIALLTPWSAGMTCDSGGPSDQRRDVAARLAPCTRVLASANAPRDATIARGWSSSTMEELVTGVVAGGVPLQPIVRNAMSEPLDPAYVKAMTSPSFHAPIAWSGP